jgi:anaphase-promoting complex subunit 10
MESSPEEVATPPSRRRNVEDEEEEEEEEEEAVAVDDEEEEEDEDATPPSSTVIRSNPTLDSVSHLRDLSKDAISWSLSSAKPGNGVEQCVRDPSTDTYWQSDGAQPHYIQVHFGRRVAVSHICLYLDYNLDESYTPKTVLVKAGMTVQDLRPVTAPTDLHEPVGWCILPLDNLQGDAENSAPLRMHLVQISILAMHQNGRDTHVRRVKLFGPKREQNRTSEVNVVERAPTFSTVGMTQFNTIR